MSGSVKMYRTRQIIQHDMPVELPNCMFRLKNIHGVVESADLSPGNNLDIFEKVKQFLKNSTMAEMAELQARQERILKQLKELEKQVLEIKSNLNVQPQPTLCICPAKPADFDIPSDLVINANPKNPPYSLLLLQKIWKDYLNLSVKTYVHSSCTELPANAKDFVKRIESFQESSAPKISIRLIWKNVSELEFLVSKLPLRGEINLLRYFTRVTDYFSYEADSNCLEIDSMLDVCHLLVNAKNKNDRVGNVQALNRCLGKGSFMLGSKKVGVLDVAAYSSLKQIPVGEVDGTLNKFLKTCESCA